MDIKQIQDKLNEMLSAPGRRLVFWYDDDASYEESIRDFALAEGVKLWIITENNWFETKLQIEMRDPDSSYLCAGGLCVPCGSEARDDRGQRKGNPDRVEG